MNARKFSGTVKRALGLAALAGGALVLGLAAAELALRVAVKRPDTYSVLLPGTRIFEPDLRFVHGIEGPARYEVNAAGLRGRTFGSDGSEYRILLVGGSTTECTLLDIEENWGTIVEADLGRTRDDRAIWVGNVGRSGLTARDHAVTVKYLLPQYPVIDLVVVLVGVNDLTVALRQGTDYKRPAPVTDPEAERIQIRNAFAISPEGLYQPLTDGGALLESPWYTKTRLYDLARRARTGQMARGVTDQIGGSNLEQWRNHRQAASAILDELPDLREPLAEYRATLTAIVSAARSSGADVVFLTQPSLWEPEIPAAHEHLLWLGGTGPFQEVSGQAYYSVSALATAMRLYNSETLNVCSDEDLECLDLAGLVPADTTLLYDDVHFTEAGSALVGRLVAEHLRLTRPDVFAPDASVDAITLTR